jgi:hypothetical protein
MSIASHSSNEIQVVSQIIGGSLRSKTENSPIINLIEGNESNISQLEDIIKKTDQLIKSPNKGKDIFNICQNLSDKKPPVVKKKSKKKTSNKKVNKKEEEKFNKLVPDDKTGYTMQNVPIVSKRFYIKQ